MKRHRTFINYLAGIIIISNTAFIMSHLIMIKIFGSVTIYETNTPLLIFEIVLSGSTVVFGIWYAINSLRQKRQVWD